MSETHYVESCSGTASAPVGQAADPAGAEGEKNRWGQGGAGGPNQGMPGDMGMYGPRMYMMYGPQPDMYCVPQAYMAPGQMMQGPQPQMMCYGPQSSMMQGPPPSTMRDNAEESDSCEAESGRKGKWNGTGNRSDGCCKGHASADTERPGFAGMAGDPCAFAAQFGADPQDLDKRFGQVMELYGDFMQGKTDPAKIMNFISSSGAHFWKGALVGAAVALLLSNSSVKSAVGDAFSGILGNGKSSAE